MYKINVLGHQLKNGKVAKAGELVDKRQLQGNEEDLLKAGFIVKATSKEVNDWKKKNVATPNKKAEAPTKKEEENTPNKKAEAPIKN